MFVEGQKVSYVGDSQARSIGDVGTVVAAGHTASWVKWPDQSMEEMAHFDISPVATIHDPDVWSPPMNHTSVRETMRQRGVTGVLDDLNNQGQLASFEIIAADALALITSRIRTDPHIAAIVAELDADDADELVATATRSLIRDAYGT